MNSSALQSPAQQSPAVRGKGPIVFFDFARGVSSQAVVIGHALNIFVPGIFFNPAHRVFYMQSFAVVIFFVLSGFLITSTVLKKKDRPDFTFGSYVIDRVARVVYPLMPALVLIVVSDFLIYGGSLKLPFINVILNPQTIVGNFLMIFNHPLLQEVAGRTPWSWLSVGPVGTGAPLWSVVAEWWIYIAFGLLAFLAFRKLKIGVFRALLLIFAIAVPVGYMAKGGYESIAWIIGMLYAVAADRMKKLPMSFHLWLTILGTAAFLVGLYYTKQNLHAAITVGSASVAFCHLYFLLDGVSNRPRTSSQASKVGAVATAGALFRRLSIFVSSYSYSLYLIHFSVVTAVWFFWHDNLKAWQLIPISFVASNVIAYLFYVLIERHFHKVGSFLKAKLLAVSSSPNTKSS